MNTILFGFDKFVIFYSVSQKNCPFSLMIQPSCYDPHILKRIFFWDTLQHKLNVIYCNILKDEIKRRDQPRAHSASQTDPVEEAEFDWNLSDRNDSETQV